MIGAIRSWEVLRHPWVTIQCFGWRTFFQALMAGPKQTFLSLLNDRAFFGFADSAAADIVKRCIDLELRAKRLYLVLAESTVDVPALSRLFTELAEEEQEHADLLQLCLAASSHVGWRYKDLPAWRSNLARLDQRMGQVEALVSQINDMESAIQTVIQVESLDINDVFLKLIADSNAEFVRKLRPFQYAVEMHLSHITTQIPELARNVDARLASNGVSFRSAKTSSQTNVCTLSDAAHHREPDVVLASLAD
jgi:rubrerythrin